MATSLLTLCNESRFSVFSESSVNNPTVPYLDDCFQQIFLITPTYLSLLIIISFYLGLYNSHRVSFYQSLKLINWITFGRYFSIFCVLCLQLSISLCNISHLTLIAQITTLLKLCANVTYLVFLFKCSRIAHFEEHFKLFKSYILVIDTDSLKETISKYI